jgi:hypothetical protein
VLFLTHAKLYTMCACFVCEIFISRKQKWNKTAAVYIVVKPLLRAKYTPDYSTFREVLSSFVNLYAG